MEETKEVAEAKVVEVVVPEELGGGQEELEGGEVEVVAEVAVEKKEKMQRR